MLLGFAANKKLIVGFLVGAVLFVGGLQSTLQAKKRERTNVHIVVKDAETNEPIFQARLTLRFKEPGGMFTRSRMRAYSAKTNAKGSYKFVGIPKGTIHLTVTAPEHQTYGKELEVEEDNQVIEVKLRKPQALL